MLWFALLLLWACFVVSWSSHASSTNHNFMNRIGSYHREWLIVHGIAIKHIILNKCILPSCHTLRINYLAHTLVTHVKFVDLCSQVMKIYTWRYAAKRSLFLSSRVSWRPLQTVGDRTLCSSESCELLQQHCCDKTCVGVSINWTLSTIEYYRSSYRSA